MIRNSLGPLILATWLMLHAPLCWSDQKTLIYFEASTDEPSGERLVFAVKEGIRQSSRLRLSLIKEGEQFQVYLLTVTSANIVGYSYAFTFADETGVEPRLLHQSSGLCEVPALTECAQTIVAMTDSQVEQFQKAVYEAMRRAKAKH